MSDQPIKRRDFLKYVGLAGGGLIVPTLELLRGELERFRERLTAR